MFTDADIIDYLIQSQLLTADQVVCEGLRITRNDYRNENRLVVDETGAGVFLKFGDHRRGVGTVHNESLAYAWIHGTGDAILMNRVPRYLQFDGKSSVLALEALLDPKDFETYHQSTCQFPQALPQQLGQTLARLHEKSAHRSDQLLQSGFETTMPAVLEFDQLPIERLESISAASLELVKLVQQYDVFGDTFRSVASTWRMECLIHGDMRLANFVTSHSATPDELDVKLVDWEFCGVGDARWDLGAVIAGYLRLWLQAIPISDPTRPDHGINAAQFSLEQIQHAVQAFWNSYQLERRRAVEFGIDEVLQFAAVNLLNTIYSLTQLSQQLTSEVLTPLQLCINVLQDPAQAATDLLGIEASKGALV